ncbi:ABC transporter permease [Jatrophihabitans endophyticus]|uniref:ABC transporter permease n=1 Tax=Jatrophihabitans endophyticus TaxID=1206085 RepID=UPI001A0EAE32|nr:ABC transporter permease [Jatrophihabitans endophyticus]MBE7190058.1 ABC transporter permease [Jatrophihabitans endophyticus]
MSEGRASDRELSRVAATRRGVHDRLATLDPDRPVTYRAGRTLRLRVEFARQLRRRRTQVAYGLLLVLPLIIAIAFQVGGGAGSGASQLVSLATSGGFNFALFTEFASVGFLLVVVVALFCGDTVASEASWASLRYLLAQPVPRARLLRQKLVVAASLSLAANVLLPVWAFVVGGLFFGWGPTQSPIGGTFGTAASLERMLVVIVFVSLQLVIVAALAFLLSTLVDNPLGAVGGAVMLVVVSNIIDQITALKGVRNFLPTHYQYAWIDTLSTPIRYDDMLRGTGSALVYAAVFLGVAWLRFDRKDVTS